MITIQDIERIEQNSQLDGVILELCEAARRGVEADAEEDIARLSLQLMKDRCESQEKRAEKAEAERDAAYEGRKNAFALLDGEVKLRLQTQAELAAIKAAQPEYMCPNCVSPWKCNGPHIPQHTIKGGYLIEEVSSSGYAAGTAGGSGAISEETVKRVLAILMHEYPGIRVAIESEIAAAQEDK